MKAKIFTSIVLMLLFTITVFAQKIEYNLKNISNLKVILDDNQNLLSPTLSQKIITETKLKLMSAGLKIAKEDEDSPILEIKPNYIQSTLSEHRILLQLRMIEKVVTNRKDKIETDAITYLDMEFYTSKDVANSVYSKLMDTMLINYLEKYLSQKGN